MEATKIDASRPASGATPAADGFTPAQRLLAILFLVLATIFCFGPLRNQIRHGSTKDYPLWLDTGQRELHGQTPYYYDAVHHEFPFMYPPGAAGLLAPLSVAGKLPLMVVLLIGNTAAWATCILVPVLLARGRLRGQPAILFWLPSLFCIVYVWDTYLEGQVAMVLVACLLGMFLCLRNRQNAGAGLLLALAAGFKGFPIAAVPYLIYRRHWRALLYTVVFLFVLLWALPACFRGPAGAWADLRTWSVGMPQSYTPDVIGQRKERSYTWQNGSLMSVANRLLRHIEADRDPEWHTPPLYVNVANLPFRQVNIIIAAVALFLCLAYLALMRWQGPPSMLADAAEKASLLILIVLFTPLSFTYNQSWLMLAMVTVMAWAMSPKRSRPAAAVAWVWFAIAVVLLIFTVRVPAFRIVRAAGNTFWADLLLLGELAWILVIERMNTPEPLPSTASPELS